MPNNPTNYQDVLDFWFKEENLSKRFAKDDSFDREIHDKFYDTWLLACQGLLDSWRVNSKGRLAEVIVLDQFSRNLMRGDKKSFSQDQMALVLSQELQKQDDYHTLSKDEKRFALMPFMHSESAQIHQRAIILFEELGDESSLHYEKLHKDIIDRFNRYPHRNKVLGRQSSQEELDFLVDNPGF